MHSTAIDKRSQSKHDDAIVVVAIGNRYLKLFETVRRQFERYAESCRADLIVSTEPLDPTGCRNILCQKMLIPNVYKDWRRIAILDIDILIAPEAESIFSALPDDAGFAAVVDARNDPAFRNIVEKFWGLPEILEETHESYFSGRGFPPFPADIPIVASINGGALLCRPSLVGSLFQDAYYGSFTMHATGAGFVDRKIAVHEEAMMAYHAQLHKLFVPLPDRFNHQFLLSLMANPVSPAVRWQRSLGYRLLKRLDERVAVPEAFYPRVWRDLVGASLTRADIVHFAGGFPFRGFVRD